MRKLLLFILGFLLVTQLFAFQVKNANVDDWQTNELLRQIFDKSFNLQPNSVSTVPTTDTLGSGESVWYVSGSTVRLYYNIENTIGYLVDSGGLSALIDDTKGDGDTANTWSADKVYDQLALKQNTLGVMIVYDQKAQNTAGGTFTSGAWQTRTLNTVQSNSITGASLASNQITLPAGTYLIEGSAPAATVNLHQAGFYNVTDGTFSIIGTTERAGTSDVTRSFFSGVITIAGTKVFDIRHRCQITCGTYGFGYAGNFAVEIYTMVKITKL